MEILSRLTAPLSYFSNKSPENPVEKLASVALSYLPSSVSNTFELAFSLQAGARMLGYKPRAIQTILASGAIVNVAYAALEHMTHLASSKGTTWTDTTCSVNTSQLFSLENIGSNLHCGSIKALNFLGATDAFNDYFDTYTESSLTNRNIHLVMAGGFLAPFVLYPAVKSIFGRVFSSKDSTKADRLTAKKNMLEQELHGAMHSLKDSNPSLYYKTIEDIFNGYA